MRLAFYAPMKAPDHPVPSGDRSIARALLSTLRLVGTEVDLASRLRSREGKGDPARQREIEEAAKEEVARLVDAPEAGAWQAWITYHNYYKAPDLIGPPVAKALGIPYVQIESTRARKRLTGPWAGFARQAEAAADAAQLIFYFTQRDAETLQRDAPEEQRLVHLRPFLDRADLPMQSELSGPMLSVGMMREGDKLASYRIIAETLDEMADLDWRLDIAGDGPPRGQVEALMQPFGDRVRFLGMLDAERLQRAYRKASLLLWPGVNEALGMVYLEAQAAGVPVVAQDRPGMQELLAPAAYPAIAEGAQGLARMAKAYLRNAALRQEAGRVARAHVQAHHLLPAAARTLAEGLARIGVTP